MVIPLLRLQLILEAVEAALEPRVQVLYRTGHQLSGETAETGFNIQFQELQRIMVAVAVEEFTKQRHHLAREVWEVAVQGVKQR